MSSPSSLEPRSVRRSLHQRRRDPWALLAAFSLASIGGCAVRPAISPLVREPPSARAAVAPPPQALDPLPLPEDSFACVRHSDCVVALGIRALRSVEDCARGGHHVAVRAATERALTADFARRCPPPPSPCSCGPGRPPTCCPPVAARYPEPPSHAACVRARCTLREGPELAAEEQREEGLGRGTDDEGECADSAACQAQAARVTSFPRGATDARGRALCPVCPRDGTPLDDEAARIERLAPGCPRMVCARATRRCVARRCVADRVRAARAPVVALAIVADPGDEAPEVPALPRDAGHRCSNSSACVLGPLASCACDHETEPMNRALAAERRRHPPSCVGMPCNRQQAPPAPPEVVCFERSCVTRDDAAAVVAARVELGRYRAARRRFITARARARQAQRRFDEVEE